MNGDKLFIDTNIALYLLSGDETLAALLHEKELYISFITQLELLGYKQLSKKEENIIREFIGQCTVLDTNSSIKEEVIQIRRAYNVKLPDCIIIASSMYLHLPIITTDKDFKKVRELDLIYYQVN